MAQLTNAADTFINKAAIEKLYIQFDRPNYAIGDTIWFKAYLLNAADLTPSLKSGILYAELANDSNKVVQRIMLPLAGGVSWGNITIDAKIFSEGGYTLRAYTNWMRNFGEDFIFKQKFYLANPFGSYWLVNSRFNLSKDDKAEKAKLRLQFNQPNSHPAILKDLDLTVRGEDKTWYKSKVQTKLDGTVDVDFSLKLPAKKLTIIAQEIGTTDDIHRAVIPVSINRPENIDLQFMPESGSLVADIPTHIGFKAINEDGKATDVEGTIYDSKQQQVARFKSAHKGMGAFDMIPFADEIYTAKIDLPGGSMRTYSLSVVQAAGTALKINNAVGTDSLTVIIAGTQANGSYYLIGQAKGGVCYSAIVNLHAGGVRSKISTTGFPTGIARFTLLNVARQPLNERLVFINHHDLLKIDIQPDKITYGVRDSIALKIKISDKDGNPVAGNFSMAVTDGSQVKIDSLGNRNIISRLLLTSDLKGNIEAPGYYFQADADGRVKQQLDNLLLTQGWVGYSWKDVFIPFQPSFGAEKDFVVTGRVTNAFNKPVAGAHVLLFSKKPEVIIDTVTNREGRFAISGMAPIDIPVYVMQARNKNGKSFNVDLKVDEFKPPVFTAPAETATPWYVNSNSKTLDFMRGVIRARAARDTFRGSGHILKEVNITAKKIVKGSRNLNGPGNADVVIDEKELEKAGRKTFLDLMKEQVKGFREAHLLLAERPSYLWTPKRVISDRILFTFVTDGVVSLHDQNWYFIKDKPIKFIIDGIPLFWVYKTDEYSAFREITSYLTSHNAEDIKGIEVNSSSKYTMKYVPLGSNFSMADIAFVEITTRAGSGPSTPYTPGTYLYKPMPFSVPKQFYRPKYAVKNQNAEKDYRPTIFWAPNIITDKQGNATVSFYASDKAGVYNLVLEGTDFNGTLGSYSRQINLPSK